MKPIRDILRTTPNLPALQEKPGTVRLPPEVKQAAIDILNDLADMPSGSKREAIDDLDRDLYREALKGIRSIDDLRAIRREVRRTCEFRPAPAKFREVVAAIIGQPTEELPAHVLASFRPFPPPDRLLVSHGDSPGYLRAKESMERLKAGKKP